jgi:hypothetical protein
MTIQQHIRSVQQTMEQACVRSGRNPVDVTLIAVSKTHPAEAVLEAVDAGLQHFGENRVEESELKIPVVSAQADKPLHWHMIGHVQSRKAKQVVPLFDVVHSVDSLKLAGKLSETLPTGKSLDILLEMNVSGETSKDGFAAFSWQDNSIILDEVMQFARQISLLPALRVIGLMTMAPIVPNREDARPVFTSLRYLRDTLQERLEIPLPHLSMGMTDDYPVAIEEGATMIRVGRAIFGDRTTSHLL